jgi:hypothetical protein
MHHEPTKSHTVTQTDDAHKKWSEEASMVGSDVREGLGKYKDVRPATGATELEQTRGTGAVHETGHTDSSVYRPQDMTDTASKVGSDQREGLGSASKGDAQATTVDKGYVEKKHTDKPHKHEKHEHHHKHDTGIYPATTTNSPYATSHTTTTTSDVKSPFTSHTTTTHEAYPSHTTTHTGTGYPGSTTTSYEKTDTSGTPSTHYQYSDMDTGDKGTYRGTTDYGSTHKGTHAGGYADPAYEGDYQETSKFGSDKREGLGTGAAYGTSSHTSSTFGGTTGEHKTSGWTDTANKTGSDVREGLGSGTHSTQGGQYQ